MTRKRGREEEASSGRKLRRIELAVAVVDRSTGTKDAAQKNNKETSMFHRSL
jgi:hypothetical protein